MPSEVRFAEVRRVLEQHGWTLIRIRGSHHVFSKPGEASGITLPVHRGKVSPVYIRQIEKAIGIKLR